MYRKLVYTRTKLQISARMATYRHQSSRATERLQILRFSEWLAVSKNSCNSIRRPGSVQLREITNPGGMLTHRYYRLSRSV